MTHIRNQLHLGDIFDAQNDSFLEHHDIENVVTVTPGELPTTTHYHPLTDGKNEYTVFEEAVNSARDAVDTDEPTLIHCTVGQSRSPTIVACLLAIEDDCSFDDALDQVRKTRHVHPAPELRELAHKYLKCHNSPHSQD